MEVIKLNAKSRTETGNQVKSLRVGGAIPATLYGPDFEPKNISVSYNTFLKAYNQSGESALVDLKLDNGEVIKVLIQDAQIDPLTCRYTHADFRKVNMKEKLEAEIELNFVGESKAINELSAILMRNMTTLAVKCLPSALVSQIDVDLSLLQKFGDAIRVSDIKLPEGMELMEDANSVVATVTEPRSEEEVMGASKPIEADVAKVEVIGEKKEEGEETVETAEKSGETK